MLFLFRRVIAERRSFPRLSSSSSLYPDSFSISLSAANVMSSWFAVSSMSVKISFSPDAVGLLKNLSKFGVDVVVPISSLGFGVNGAAVPLPSPVLASSGVAELLGSGPLGFGEEKRLVIVFILLTVSSG